MGRIIRSLGGLIILGSVVLGLLSPARWSAWYWVTAFMAVNFLQSALTNWCPGMTLISLFKKGIPPGNIRMERILRAMSGLFTLIGLAVGAMVHPGGFWFAGFVGFNLLQSAFTNWCPAITILRKAKIV